jgi:hypothetical protein
MAVQLNIVLYGGDVHYYDTLTFNWLETWHIHSLQNTKMWKSKLESFCVSTLQKLTIQPSRLYVEYGCKCIDSNGNKFDDKEVKESSCNLILTCNIYFL